MSLKFHKTERGFGKLNFLDRYDAKCSIQKSSLATEDAIWFGVDDVEPKVMASEAHKVGIETDQNSGFVDYPLPKEVYLTTRMHLTQDQVKVLLPILQKFAETGEIS